MMSSLDALRGVQNPPPVGGGHPGALGSSNSSMTSEQQDDTISIRSDGSSDSSENFVMINQVEKKTRFIFFKKNP